MASHQIGNVIGVAANGNQPTILANITADGANTITVDDASKLVVGMAIDIVTKASGVVVASNRTISDITSANVVTYSGGDVTATTAEGVYPTGGYAPSGQANANGGIAGSNGFDLDSLDSIAAMRLRLAAFNGTLYSAAMLNTMTMNDMVYAIRLIDAPATVK